MDLRFRQDNTKLHIVRRMQDRGNEGTTENDTTLIAHNEPNIISGNINPQGYRSYAQVTQNISQATLNQNQSKNIEDATEIKEMLKQSIKSTEMLGKMISAVYAPSRHKMTLKKWEEYL
ncbi:uncharacterized protein LOC122575005 [Bombus pyrosoma]|uniref:uncharacterized protein LOC122575005 n=1 Tax=Bombus pyrosoma TaxID=396416 RepID=UPI001CB9A2B5|nr:uncharacterized protein LOC122575005 [Bombus pyrosoma]